MRRSGWPPRSPLEQWQLADQRLHQRRLAGAVGAEQCDAIAGFEDETDLVQHRVVAVTAVGVGHAQQRVRQLRRRRELDPQRALDAHRLGVGHLGQALDPRLRLLGLGRAGAEAIDEALQVRALGLRLFVGDLLQAQVLGALALERGVVARVELGLAVVQVQRVGGDLVEELAVVRDQQQRARVLEQPLLQPQHRVEVEVVGRLVEQQQVARRHQRARQVQAHAPAAGEFLDRALVGVG